MNNFLEFYQQNSISPVSQNIADMERHVARRVGLYRCLGLTPMNFSDRNVLEVAPGSGYNSIVTVAFGPGHYTLVEPNAAGYREMLDLFDRHQLIGEKVEFLNQQLEDLPGEKQYDIVLCEGLIPGLNNRGPFVSKLAAKVRSGGTLVVTCADSVSAFFESLRRYLSRIIVSQMPGDDIDRTRKIVQQLSSVFRSHLGTLKGMSRPIDDWIFDNLLNPATCSLSGSNEFSVENCLEELGDEFYFLGSSPRFLSDWTWYKELPVSPADYNEPIIDSYRARRLDLLHYKELIPEDRSTSNEIYRHCKQFSLTVEARAPQEPGRFSIDVVRADVRPVYELLSILERIGSIQSRDAVRGFLGIFSGDMVPSISEIADQEGEYSQAFREAFGRGQQYVSLVRS